MLIACALIGGAIGGTGGFALASAPWSTGRSDGPRLSRVQRVARNVLDSVDASLGQESKIHAIIAATFDDRTPDPDEGDVGRRMVALLSAPTIDRGVVERLRADQSARYDATSKRVVAAVLDAADQLTPGQRARLADAAGGMMARGRMLRWWRGGPDKG